jgi:hypothetical protein
MIWLSRRIYQVVSMLVLQGGGGQGAPLSNSLESQTLLPTSHLLLLSLCLRHSSRQGRQQGQAHQRLLLRRVELVGIASRSLAVEEGEEEEKKRSLSVQLQMSQTATGSNTLQVAVLLQIPSPPSPPPRPPSHTVTEAQNDIGVRGELVIGLVEAPWTREQSIFTRRRRDRYI